MFNIAAISFLALGLLCFMICAVGAFTVGNALIQPILITMLYIFGPLYLLSGVLFLVVAFKGY